MPIKQTKKQRTGGRAELLDAASSVKKGLPVGPRSFSREKVLLPKTMLRLGLFEQKRDACQVLLEGGLQGSPPPLSFPRDGKTNPDVFWA